MLSAGASGAPRVAVLSGVGAEEAVAQPPLDRSEALPFEAVDRVSGGMRLGNHAAGEVLAPVVVVAPGAGEVELALAAVEGFPACLEKRPGPRVDLHVDREPRQGRV
jgi:hypothetical protein